MLKRVVKVGGRAQESPLLGVCLAGLWKREPRSFCVVHGGGAEVTSLQKRLGVVPVFHEGRRVTSQEDVAIVRMVLSGSVNKRLVARLRAAHVAAVGLSGEDGDLIVATVMDDARLGKAGTPVSVNLAPLECLLHGGFLPVISPVSRDENDRAGEPLNVNADDAAAAIAAAARCGELVLVSDVEGVLNESGAVIESLDVVEARRLIRGGRATQGMSAKLDAATAAIDAGVEVVRICAVEGIADFRRGTRVVPIPHAELVG